MSIILIVVALIGILSVCNAAERKLVPAQKRDLQQLLRTANSGSINTVSRSLSQNYLNELAVDGLETSYDEYSQAWRMLGMYVDCGEDDEIYYGQQENVAAGRRRRRNERQRRRRTDQVDGDNNDAEADGDAEENADNAAEEQQDEAEVENNGEEEADDNNSDVQKDCKRYLLWAAVSLKLCCWWCELYLYNDEKILFEPSAY
jgi:hypothetical protein